MMKPLFKSLQKLVCRTDEAFEKCDLKDIYLVVSILLISALLLAGLLILVGYIVFQEMSYTLPLLSEKNIQTLPVLCEELSLSSDEDFETFNTGKENLGIFLDSKGKYVCEGKNFTEVSYKIVERQSRLRISKGLANDPYIACGNEILKRKSGYQTVSFRKISHRQKYQDNVDVKLQWDKHMTHSYIDPVISYHNGEVTIPEGQTYFVYASVHININISNLYEGRLTTGSHRYTLRICRKVYEYEETLLSKTEVFSGHEDIVESSLRIEGPLQLNRNDAIYVKVSNGNHLILKSHGNAFGLYPL